MVLTQISPKEEKWESHEKILMKTVPMDNSPITVVGIKSIGLHYKKWKEMSLSQLSEQERYIDNGSLLNQKTTDSLIHYLKRQHTPVTYVDPSAWIEEIEIDPLTSYFANWHFLRGNYRFPVF